jgi:signal transduction histidine kinase/ActR/RegA family two-component response regulator
MAPDRGASAKNLDLLHVAIYEIDVSTGLVRLWPNRLYEECEESLSVKAENSCQITKALIEYVRSRSPQNLHLLWEPVRGRLPEGEDPEVFLTDQNNWISAEICRDIMEQTKKATSDEMAVYKAGFESITRRKLGYIGRIVVRALFGPKHAIQKAPKINDKVNRTKKVEIISASNTHALLRLHWFKDLPLTRDFCLINKGIYQAMSTIWDLPPADLEEKVCFFEGGPYCEYEMWWEKKSLWKLFFRRRAVKREVLDSLINEMEQDKELLRHKYEEVTGLNVELERKIASLMSLQEASQAVVSILDEQGLIQTIMNLVKSVIGFDRAVLFLVDDKQEKLRFAQAVGAMDSSLEVVRDYEVDIDRMTNIIARVAATGRPKFVKDVEKSDLRKGNILLSLFQPSNFAAAPLIARNKVIGVLAGEVPSDIDDVSEPDLNLLMTFSNQIAVAIENARLYRDLERTYRSSLQAQKMEAVGNLAGGIAHDFNNILQAILGNASLALYDLEKESPLYHKVKQIESSAERASGLIRQLLTFSRKGESQPRPIDLNFEVKEVRKLLSSTIPKMIQIETDLEPELKMIDADPVQVNQILMNLAVNARDAMPDGGKLVVGTKNIYLDEQFCRTHSGATSGSHVMLWVSDTGHGIEKAVLNRIFEPFFTTKASGQGTGLGLATVYGIVKGHKGYITCESERGSGTTFTVYFRALAKTAQEHSVEHLEDHTVLTGTETILLVDDEAGTRDYVKEMLDGYGYAVLSATSGEEALEVFAREKGRIEVVILDVIMAGMGGKRCLDELLKLDPLVKVLMTTGYPESELIGEALESGAKEVLKKPFHAYEMVKSIRRIIDDQTIPTETTSSEDGPGLRVVSSN